MSTDFFAFRVFVFVCGTVGGSPSRGSLKAPRAFYYSLGNLSWSYHPRQLSQAFAKPTGLGVLISGRKHEVIRHMISGATHARRSNYLARPRSVVEWEP